VMGPTPLLQTCKLLLSPSLVLQLCMNLLVITTFSQLLLHLLHLHMYAAEFLLFLSFFSFFFWKLLWLLVMNLLQHLGNIMRWVLIFEFVLSIDGGCGYCCFFFPWPVNFFDRVLSSMSLTGTLSPQIGALSNLTDL